MEPTEKVRRLVITPKNPRVFQRPPHAEETVRRILNEADCTKCGRCCRGRTFPILITLEEREAIRSHLMANRRVQDSQSLKPGYIELFHGQCALLGRGAGESICSIYDFRPSECRAYPLNPIFESSFARFDPILKEMLATTGKLPKMVLGFTSHCPPILRVAEQEISYILLTDIAGPVQTPPFLKSTVQWLVAETIRSRVSLPEVVLGGEAQPFIPILDLPASLVLMNATKRISGFLARISGFGPKPPESH